MVAAIAQAVPAGWGLARAPLITLFLGTVICKEGRMGKFHSKCISLVDNLNLWCLVKRFMDALRIASPLPHTQSISNERLHGLTSCKYISLCCFSHPLKKYLVSPILYASLAIAVLPRLPSVWSLAYLPKQNILWIIYFSFNKYLMDNDMSCALLSLSAEYNRLSPAFVEFYRLAGKMTVKSMP